MTGGGLWLNGEEFPYSGQGPASFGRRALAWPVRSSLRCGRPARRRPRQRPGNPRMSLPRVTGPRPTGSGSRACPNRQSSGGYEGRPSTWPSGVTVVGGGVINAR